MKQRAGKRKTEGTGTPARFQNTADAGVSYQSQGSPGAAARQNDNPTFLTAVSEAISKLTNEVRRWWRNVGAASRPREPVEPSNQAREAIDVLNAKKSTSFNDDNPSHEEMLKELWGLLKPGVPFERISKNWDQIGFQGTNPATDFRGQGLLGLVNLVYFARHFTDDALEILERPHSGFPLAIAAINVSAKLTEMLAKHPGEVGNRLFGGSASSAEMESRFNELFAMVFANFEQFYSDRITAYLNAGGNPAFTIMQYNPIQKEYFETVLKAVQLGEFDAKYSNPALSRRSSRAEADN